MGWTEPRTWVDSEIVTAVLLNAHLRDNLLEIGPHVRVVKAADESISSSSTPQGDDHLFFQVGANETWIVLIWLAWVDGGRGMSLTFAGPSGSTIKFGLPVVWNGSTPPVFSIPAWATAPAVISLGRQLDVNCSSIVYASVLSGSTGGQVTFQWAQSAPAGAGATVVKAGSFLLAHRVG